MKAYIIIFCCLLATTFVHTHDEDQLLKKIKKLKEKVKELQQDQPRWRVSTVIPRGGGYSNGGYRSENFTSNGGALLIFVSATAYTSSAGMMQVNILLNQETVGSLKSTNNVNNHQAFPSNVIIVSNAPAGEYKLTMSLVKGVANGHDYIEAIVLEVPSGLAAKVLSFAGSNYPREGIFNGDVPSLLFTSATAYTDHNDEYIRLNTYVDDNILGTLSCIANRAHRHKALSSRIDILPQTNNIKRKFKMSLSEGKANDYDYSQATMLPLPHNQASASIPIKYKGSVLPRKGNFTTDGGDLMIFASASASFERSADININVLVDGQHVRTMTTYSNEANNHNAVAPSVIVLRGIPAGNHTVELKPAQGVKTNTGDFSQVVVLELLP